MTQADYDKHAQFILAHAAGIETAKRPGYTRGDVDVLKNFKAAGASARVSPEQAWTVFFLKHIDAIVTHMTQPDLPVSEAMEGRFADAINYLKLGWALLVEREALDVKAAEGLLRAQLPTFNAKLTDDACECSGCANVEVLEG